ncbi:MAG: succinate-semialdehyde dehydrogenase/glutarate-semialdehyde dehydrogenase, partial [Myxococcota bacterium]
YISGQWISARSGATFPVIDPASGATIASVPDCGAEETQAAITAAERALPDWRALTASVRSDCLVRLHDLMLTSLDSLAELLVYENGKPLAEAKGEIRYAASFVRWFAEEGRRVYGETIPASQPNKRILVTREPVGVCALITPWNFPCAMLARKLAPALAAGCTIVAKPAEETPLSALALAALCEQAGIPAGVVNVVTSAKPEVVGGVLTASPVVRKLSFTGSTEVGELLMKQCAPTLKRLSLELGGSAPLIVFDDADLKKAVDGAMASKFRNCGQTCVASNRFLVHDSLVTRFAAMVTSHASQLHQGHGLKSTTTIGPMISRAARDKVDRLIADAIGKGATVWCGGRPTGDGLFVAPTVLTGVTGQMDVWSEEIFGPVIAIREFVHEVEAVTLANATPYGLAAYFFTEDIGRSWRVAEALDFGMVGVNTGMMSTAQAPFGGVKRSGIGREGSRHGIDEYLEIKYTCIAI